jgi:hypothetical protein
MMLFAPADLLLAQTDATAERVVYELGRLRDFDDERLPIVAIAVGTISILALVCYLYRRDSVELRRSVGAMLALFRCVALLGLLVYFLGIERRTTREVVHHSQVAVLVDVSQSMGLADRDGSGKAAASSRLDNVVATIEDTPLLTELRERHDVNVARFDLRVQPVVSLPKSDAADGRPRDVGENGGDENRNFERGAARSVDSQIHLATNEQQTPGQLANEATPLHVDWSEELAPRGTETRLGDALDEQLRLYRNAPLAGLIVISDGAQNAGIEPTAAVEAARQANVPIYTIGVGATEPIRNLAVSDLLVPARAFPGDTVNVIGYIQSTGYADRFVDVELVRRGSEEAAGAGTLVASQRIQLGDDGQIVAVSFDIEPDVAGRFVYQIRTVAPADDGNPRDNNRESEMDVVDRQTRVLLFASGPTREYRFLRGQLYRDPTMQVDVLLQTAQPGMSQEADNILASFPDSREELFEYDCIVALDPDWRQLDAAQVALVESWVAKEAGGMIVVPGPIYTALWTRSTEHAKLRDLYPVVFQRRLTLLDDGHFGGELAWPLEFDRAGRDARFLWLGNTAEENDLAWTAFPGVYGYYAVKGEKPGATVYARVADPEAGLGDERPVYLAGQFYGAGQVLYIGSGEFWRLRAVDPSYFEVLYTKLVRQVSQGRLLRGSSRGALLVDRDRYELGETIILRGRLTDAQHEPLLHDSVTAQFVRPDGTTEPVKLPADVQQPGMFTGQVAVHQEGTYQIVLPVPDTSEEPLSQFIQVRVPDRERAHPERNAALLAALANETGGRYYPELKLAAFGDGDVTPLAEAIASRAEVKLLKGAPDQGFAQTQMQWLLGIVAGALFLEWIVRRVNRLA